MIAAIIDWTDLQPLQEIRADLLAVEKEAKGLREEILGGANNE